MREGTVASVRAALERVGEEELVKLLTGREGSPLACHIGDGHPAIHL
jgi:hypothetical protein